MGCKRSRAFSTQSTARGGRGGEGASDDSHDLIHRTGTRGRGRRGSDRKGVEDPGGKQALDPLAVSYLQNQGFSPGEIKVLVGQGDPLAVSYLRNHGFPQAQVATRATAKAIDPLAVSYLQNQGFSPGEIKVLVGQGDPLAVSYLRNRGFPQAPTQIVGTSAGFDWADAEHRRGSHAGHRARAGRPRGRVRDPPPEPPAERRQRLDSRSSGRPPTRRRGGPDRARPLFCAVTA